MEFGRCTDWIYICTTKLVHACKDRLVYLLQYYLISIDFDMTNKYANSSMYLFVRKYLIAVQPCITRSCETTGQIAVHVVFQYWTNIHCLYYISYEAVWVPAASATPFSIARTSTLTSYYHIAPNIRGQ